MSQNKGDEYIDLAMTFAKQAALKPERNCKFMRKLCSNFIRDVNQGVPGYYLSPLHVARICSLVEALPHVKGRQFAGTIKLQPWQAFHYANIFGWVDEIDDTRKHSIAFTQVSKKNGKSTMAAPIGIYMLSPLEGERGAEVYCAASKKDQANIVLNVARQMLKSSPSLMVELNMSVWAREIECDIDGVLNKMYSVASDSPQTDDGINPSCILMDEVHAMTDGELRGTLIKGTVARQNGLAYEISTAGELRDDSPCLEENLKAHKWIKGDVELPHFYAMVFEQDDPTEEIEKPKTWYKSNPNLDVTFSSSKLKAMLDDARDSPMLMNQFKQKHMNCFTGSTESWLSMSMWTRSQRKPEDMPKGLDLFLGFDLSSVLDLSAVGGCWIDKSKSRPEYWIGADCFAARRGYDENALVKQYVDEGLVELLGDKIDEIYIRDHIFEIAKRENLIEIGFDSWNASRIAEDLAEKFELVEVRQGAKTFSEPMKNFEAEMRAGRVHIMGDKCLTWQAGNLVVKRDRNDNWAPVKESKQNKVDGMIAILIAFVRAWRHTKGEEWLTADEVIAA